MRRSIALFLLAASVAACAPTGQTSPDRQVAARAGGPMQCFQANRVINFRGGDSQSLYVRVLGGGVFEVTSAGCPDLESTNAMALTPTIGIGDRLCVGDSARITILNPSTAISPCPARIVRSLSEAEVDALPGAQRP